MRLPIAARPEAGPYLLFADFHTSSFPVSQIRFPVYSFPMPAWLLRFLRFALIGVGAMTLTSSVINIIAAIRLIEPSDEVSLGATKGEIVSWFIGPLLLGIALIVLGFWPWKKKPPKS